MTQEQLAYIVDRAPRTIMYNENDGQHPSLNTFYQMVTMFDISVDQYFYPSKIKGASAESVCCTARPPSSFHPKRQYQLISISLFRPSADRFPGISSCTKETCAAKQYAQYIFSYRIQKWPFSSQIIQLYARNKKIC